MRDIETDTKIMTAEIVAAFVAGNQITISDIGGLVANVFAVLSDLSAPTRPAETAIPAKATTAQIRKSVTPYAITCLICGQNFKTLRRHLNADHRMTPQQYFTAFTLPHSYPLVAANYSALRSALAKSSGLGSRGGGHPGQLARNP